MSAISPAPTPAARPRRTAPALVVAGLAALAVLGGGAAARPAAEAPAPPSPPAVGGNGPDHVVVPLSAPDRPARLEVSVLQGSITVTAGTGRDIVIDSTPMDDDDDAGRGARHAGRERDRDRDRAADAAKTAGMHRIGGGGPGIQVEEADNVVEVDAGPFAGPVALRIQVPVHTALDLALVNGGDVTVQGVDGEIELRNTNGGITATNVGGSVVAETVNGDVKVSLDRAAPGKALAFTSFNGDIDVTLPASYKADVRMKTQNGEVWSDFDLDAKAGAQVTDERKNGRHRISIEHEIRGTLAGGGPELRLETFNGSIYLRKK